MAGSQGERKTASSDRDVMKQIVARLSGKLPLRAVIVVPFLLQIVSVVGLVGWFSFRNGQTAVEALATQLRLEVSDRVRQHLDGYLAAPHQINQINADAIGLGLLNLQDLKTAERYFWKQLQVFNVGYITFCSSKGEYIGAYRRNDGRLWIEVLEPSTQGKLYSYATNSQGNRTQLVEVTPNYKPLQASWYVAAVKARKPLWTPIYQYDGESDILALSASYPVYDKSKRLVGVLSIDLLLDQISNFLHQLKISPSGKIFILERNGFVVASSTEPPYTIVRGKAQRLKASESKDPLIRATTQHLFHRFDNLSQIKQSQPLSFNYNNQRQFVQLIPWQDKLGLDWLILVVVPEADFMGHIHANTRTTILLCLLSLAGAILVGLQTSKWLVKPISKLSIAAKHLSEGNWEQHLSVGRSREISQLAQSFNSMVQQLKELFETLEEKVRERTAELAQANTELEQKNALIRRVFGRYLTNEVVATLLESPEALKLGGQRKKITILTSDLRGFTAQAEQLPSEDVVEILNFYLHHMADVITQYEGTIDEFMGDGILVLFGAPTAKADDAKRAVACAVAMQMEMIPVNEKMKERGWPLLEMGIGIHTGEVVVGNIGSEKRTKYGVVGSHVNLTYRIESYTTGGQILISESTLKEVESVVKIENKKQVQPKGLKQPLSIYEVVGIGGDYNLILPKEEEELVVLTEAIPIQYRILNEKHINNTIFRGSLIKLSKKGAVIRWDDEESQSVLTPLTNLEISLLNFLTPAELNESFYGKALEVSTANGDFYIRFTSQPSLVRAMFEELYSIHKSIEKLANTAAS